MKILIVFLVLLPVTVFAGDFDKIDKELYASVCVMQFVDGLTTVDYLRDDHHGIMNRWNWKYGCARPSTEHLWAVKGVELIGCYYVAKWLPPVPRKIFLFTANALLISCVQHNLNIGAGFSFGF